MDTGMLYFAVNLVINLSCRVANRPTFCLLNSHIFGLYVTLSFACAYICTHNLLPNDLHSPLIINWNNY